MRPPKIIIWFIISSFILFVHPSFELNAEENERSEQLAREKYWKGDFSEAIRLWKSLLPTLTKQQQAEIHSYLGIAYKQMGQLSQSLHHFNQALDLYSLIKERRIDEVRIELAKLFNDLGQGQRAITMGQEVLASIEPTDSYLLEPLALQAIATGFLLKGELDTAINVYKQAQDLALEQPEALLSINNNLGIALQRRKEFFLHQASLAFAEGYEEEGKELERLAEQDEQTALSLLVNNLKLVDKSHLSSISAIKVYLSAFQRWGEGQYLLKADSLVQSLPSSRSKAEFLLELAKFQDNPLSRLEQANQISSQLKDYRTQSFALGQMGSYYERERQYIQALKFTQKAQLAAQVSPGYHNSLYRWQWQSGRLYQSLGQTEKAKTAYRGAIASLKKLRHEIAIANSDFQLDVLEETRPIYRELLALLLTKTESLNPQQIREILAIRNQLELTELQSFFGDACLELQQTQSQTEKKLPPNLAKIHYILLEENSYQILELSNGTFRVFSLEIGKADLEDKLMDWREMLLTSRIPRGYEPLSKELYTILVGRVIPLVPSNIKQLIFVSDGLLRNVPLAALMDAEQQFLIEKYAIASSLGLSIQTKPVNNFNDSVAFGLSVETESSPPLPFVRQEVSSVSKILQARNFLDSNFTRENFREQVLKQYDIVHLATHALFAGSAQDTYFQAFDSLILLTELETLLRKAGGLQLLFLSACKTAAGNERSVLGLAGVSARVGVPDTIASLWSVRDATTEILVTDFYSILKGENLPAADSLRQAQLKLLHLHPKFWASFILIAND